MSAVVVDWLGRGGIAQTTPAWVSALRRAGHETVVVTRGGRELVGEHVRAPAEAAHPIRTHRRVAALAAATIHDLRPDVVVVQNYVLPPLETALDRALRSTGARSIVVIHDHRLHSPLAGTRSGLRRRLLHSDIVVTHSRFVADAVAAFSGRNDIDAVPLPLPPDLTTEHAGRSVFPETPDATALLFGIVKRSYKGMDVLRDLAAEGVDGWRFAAAGVGAPTTTPGIVGVSGFLPAADLVATVASARAAVLPYRIASQSAAVVLAQALGTVPVAAAVGGIPEQITSGVDGILVPAGASVGEWRQALQSIPEALDDLGAAAVARVHAGDRAFRELVHGLV